MPTDIDNLTSAETPNPDLDSLLNEIDKTTKIHGPCGDFNRNSPCMLNGSCSKRYPCPLCKDIKTANDGYAQYRRPSDSGFTVDTRIKGLQINHQWTVPYSPVWSTTMRDSIRLMKMLCFITINLFLNRTIIICFCKLYNCGRMMRRVMIERVVG